MAKKAASQFKITHLIGDSKAKLELYRNKDCPSLFLFEASQTLSNKLELTDIDKEIYGALIQNPYTPEAALEYLENIYQRFLTITPDSFDRAWLLPSPESVPFHSKFKQRVISNIREKSQIEKLFIKVAHGNFMIARSLANDVFLSGNAIAGLFTSSFDSVNDFDFFFKSEESATRFVLHALSLSPKVEHHGLEVEKERDGICVKGLKKAIVFELQDLKICITRNAVTFYFNNHIPLQFVTKIVGTPDFVISQFDFAHVKSYYDLASGKLHYSNAGIYSIQTKQLIFEGGMNPFNALLRTRKFQLRGWQVNTREIFKIGFAISKIDLSNPAELENALSTFYGESISAFIEKELNGKTKLTIEDICMFLSTIPDQEPSENK